MLKFINGELKARKCVKVSSEQGTGKSRSNQHQTHIDPKATRTTATNGTTAAFVAGHTAVGNRNKGGQQKNGGWKASLPCLFCKVKEHVTNDCPLAPNKREAAILKQSWCTFCFKWQHMAKDCTTAQKCRKCEGDHNELLYPKLQTTKTRPVGGSTTQNTTTITALTTVGGAVILKTAMVKLHGPNGSKKIR